MHRAINSELYQSQKECLSVIYIKQKMKRQMRNLSAKALTNMLIKMDFLNKSKRLLFLNEVLEMKIMKMLECVRTLESAVQNFDDTYMIRT